MAAGHRSQAGAAFQPCFVLVDIEFKPFRLFGFSIETSLFDS